jgi:hypothetical protein
VIGFFGLDITVPQLPYRWSQNVAYLFRLPPACIAVERIFGQQTVYTAKRSLDSNSEIYSKSDDSGQSNMISDFTPHPDSALTFLVGGLPNIAKRCSILNYSADQERECKCLCSEYTSFQMRSLRVCRYHWPWYLLQIQGHVSKLIMLQTRYTEYNQKLFLVLNQIFSINMQKSVSDKNWRAHWIVYFVWRIRFLHDKPCLRKLWHLIWTSCKVLERYESKLKFSIQVLVQTPSIIFSLQVDPLKIKSK